MHILFKIAFTICLNTTLFSLHATDAKDITMQSYDASAQAYATHTGKIDSKTKTSLFLSHLGPSSHILDVGCGPGHDAEYFVSCGHHVIGIDFSQELITLAKQRVPQATFHVTDMEEISFAEESFDAIWASASLLHIPKKSFAQLLCTFNRIIRPNGIIYISLKKGIGEVLEPDERYDGIQKFWAYYSQEELINYLTNAGFELLETETYEKANDYQTHSWISVICKRRNLH